MSKMKKLTPDWKRMDIADVVEKDLNAAIAFLSLIRDKPEILQGVTIAIEEWRKLMIENEGVQGTTTRGREEVPLTTPASPAVDTKTS